MPSSSTVNKRPIVKYAPARVSSKHNSHGPSYGSSQNTSHGSSQASFHGLSRSTSRGSDRAPKSSARDSYSSDDDGRGSVAY